MTAILDAAPSADVPETIADAGPARRARPPRRPRRPLPLGLGIVFALGALGAWCLVYGLAFSSMYEARSQKLLYGDLRASLAAEEAPTGGAIAPGTPIGLIDIPNAGVHDVVIIEGTSSSTMRKGPGHLRSTPLPGQPGRSVVFGRSLTFGAPFRHISSLEPQEQITVTTQEGVFTYQVEQVRHVGEQTPAPTSDKPGLTLVTSEGGGWRSGWAPSRPVYVDATLVGDPQPPTAAPPGAVPSDEQVLTSDTSDLPLLVLALQLLLLAIGAVAWAATRWTARQAWLVGAPIILGVLWLVTNVAAPLLPNLV